MYRLRAVGVIAMAAVAAFDTGALPACAANLAVGQLRPAGMAIAEI